MGTAQIKYVILGILIAAGFVIFTGFKLPGPSEQSGNYQFFKEKDTTGVWVFEPDTGTSKYFDIEKGVVIVNSFQMDSITVRSDVKSTRAKVQ